MLSLFIGFPDKSKEGKEGGGGKRRPIIGLQYQAEDESGLSYLHELSLSRGDWYHGEELLRVLRELLNETCMRIVSLRSLMPCVRSRLFSDHLFAKCGNWGFQSFVKVNKFTREILAGIKSNKNFKMKNNASRK